MPEGPGGTEGEGAGKSGTAKGVAGDQKAAVFGEDRQGNSVHQGRFLQQPRLPHQEDT
jgi:hypothetical protein